MNKIDDLVKIMLNNKELNQECKSLYKYFYDVFANYEVHKDYNLHFRIPQVVEIVYSNKLEGIDLNIYNCLIAYSIRNFSQKVISYLDDKCKMKEVDFYSCGTNFLLQGFISKICEDKKHYRIDTFSSILVKFLHIIEENYKNCSYDIDAIYESINMDLELKLNKLLNGNFSNNPLYFFPLFLLLVENIIKPLKYKHIVRSAMINLYLLVNKLLFSPTLSLSYPLLYSLPEYINLIDEVNINKNKIIDFSKFIYDLLKQAAVISRATIQDFSNITNKLENLIQKYPKIFKDDITLKCFFCSTIFEENLILDIICSTSLKELNKEDIKNNKKRINKVFEILKEYDMLTKIWGTDKNKINLYIFKHFHETLKKLNKNKTDKTTKIFILNENLN